MMPTELTRSDTHVLLADRHRRLALRILRTFDPPLAVDTLADRIVKRIDRPGTTIENVSLGLYHCHLPMLADADVVAFDPAERTVAPGPNFDAVSRVDDMVTDQ